MLAAFIPKLKANLISRDKWHPFPTLEEREAWTALPRSAREALHAQGESLLDYVWPGLSATLFLEFKRNGNRSRYQNVRYARRGALRDLVLAECVEGQGRFLDDIVNGIWTTCEETYWGVPAHINMQRAGVDLPDAEEPTVDLFAAETGALLAWTVYLLGARLDSVSPLVRPRIHNEVKRRILDPCLARDDFWWMSFDPGVHSINNWNPWINSNWITAALLLEKDETRRAAALSKSMRSLDLFLGIYAEAGGCDEGPGYWGRAAASLFDCLELLYSATEGAVDVYGEPKVQNMGRFIYRTHIHDHYFVNFADASALNNPSAALVFNYGRRIGDADMQSFGAWLLGKDVQGAKVRSGSLGRTLPALFSLNALLATAGKQPLPRDAWFDGIQVMVARDQAGSEKGFFVAAKGGHNNESHNHNDIGNFVVYVDGRPVIVDAGVETYTRKTFSPQRYEIWTMQSAYHSLLPTIDGVMQAPGRTFAAQDVQYQATEATAQLSLDISAAYPAEAHVDTWQRSITLHRGDHVEIEDHYVLGQAASEITLGLLTPCDVETPQPGVLWLKESSFGQDHTSGSAHVHYDADTFEVTVEAVPITDIRLGGVWGDQLTRIVFTATDPATTDTWTFKVSR